MKQFFSISVIVAILGAVAVLFFSQWHVVTRIVDGDTIEVMGYDKNIRLMGIDAAEDGECYRSESTKIISDLLLNKKQEGAN